MSRPAITRVSNLQVDPSSTNRNNGFYPPVLTTAQRDQIPNPQAGCIIFNSDTNFTQIYQIINGVNLWLNLTATASAATGVGLVTGTSNVIPSGAAAGVEAAGNQVVGFVYYDTTSNTAKIRTNAAWLTIQAV